ncbi:sec-independent protein translocase protein TatA [Microbacterium ginsengiterrae]|uniref:Sec-independent protein translocase protein TatA n=1 Tax=Microbacterium ginsengiterrae TaxID=546115 RepID=A0A7W9CEC8_9MICO|nr:MULTISPECIES: Sec-independent protein translocase subunit TatA [Microbacterium]MBB5744082.1 sec-independent protein translocase protein TatA [Microbacterium ginsengiterrae]
MAGLTGWHLLVLVLVILLLFGAAKLPALAKSMGQSARVFKGEMKAMKEEDAATQQNVADAPVVSTTSENSAPPRNDGGNSGTPTT